MSSKNGTKKAKQAPENNAVILKVLTELGNSNPKPHQIKLVESLLFKVMCPHPILFHHKLSESERSCLLLASRGKTIKQTAHLLSVKESTVTTLRKRMLEKLGCRSIAHAVFTGLSYGYLSNEISPEQKKDKPIARTK